MRFLTFVRAAVSEAPPPPEVIEAVETWAAENTRTGKLIDRGGLMPGARVRLSGGKVTVTDGPFPEAKEVIGGYAILELPSQQAAIDDAVELMELHRKNWPGWEGETEIRPIFDPDFAPDASRS
jgi:hypothetical protein